jgi:predicted DNA-binding transcriptional regulator YafY
MQHETDGSIRLSVPYGDPRELIMEVLRYGADVEVLAPAELRKDIADRLVAAAAHYTAQPLVLATKQRNEGVLNT